jgi:NADP-dependent 3-hydroxy acid dehydrogenase YdfG
MIIDLTGKRAVVSGSTAGIGLAIATGLARAGAEVVVNGRTEQRVQDAIATIRESVPTAILSGIASDLSTAEGAAQLVAGAAEADILVNSVGAALFKPFDDLTDEDWLAMYQLNVMSGVRLTRHYLPGMMGRGWGRIVFISSESALNVPKEMIDYGMTKAAQLAVSRGVAELAAQSGVTARTDALRRLRRGAGGHRAADRTIDRRGGAGLPGPEPADLAARALLHHRGDRQHGRLRLLAAGIGHQRHGAARRWRRGPHDRVISGRRPARAVH